MYLYRLEDLIQTNVKGSPCRYAMVPAAEDIPAVFCGCTEEIRSIFQDAKNMEEQFKQNASVSDNDQAASLTSIGEPEGSRHATVGINEDLELIIERVTSRDKSLQIIPIVGMGGIGKTTLARAVYEDPEIVSHFDLCFWVTISQEFKVQDILQGLLEGQKPTIEQNAQSLRLQEALIDAQKKRNSRTLGDKKLPEEKHNVEPLDVQVHKYLFNRRFLIVMDDIWHPEAWEGVMSAIPKDHTGSRVILTTRSSAVAEKVDSSSRQHQMQLMNKEAAWDLLRENVYICTSCLPEFEAMGRRIAEKCDGLPLTIVVVGGLLKSNMTKEYWQEVERNINEAASRDGQLDAVLSLSYNNLPVHLKSCFLYMGVFPEDFRISASHLFWLWIAEGFIKPQAPKTLEEIAEEYLEDLVKRNLVLVAAKRCNGKIRSCSIHDVPRELSLRIAKQANFLQRFAGEYIDDHMFRNTTTSQRHVSISSKRFDTSSPSDAYDINTYVRSLVLINCPVHFKLMRFRLLKVLYGVKIYGESMLRQIFELTNLKLLQFSCNVYNDFGSRDDLVVPQSISKLQKLETLIVAEGSSVTIPEDIWKIRNLRHIVLPKKNCTLILPRFYQDYPRVLEDMQTLSFHSHSYYSEFTNRDIRRMPNLKKLKAAGVYYMPSNVGDLWQLQNLAVSYRGENLVFPHSIQKLHLQQTDILSWNAVGSLPNLQVLKLSGYYYSNSTTAWEPKEGGFLQLKHLEVNNTQLKYWVAESTHFPCLERLVLVDLPDLEGIPLDIGCIPTLQKLIVNRCSTKVSESAERIQEEAPSSGNDALQVVIITDRQNVINP